MRTLLILAAAVALVAGSASAATQCRDAKGKFIKCPAPPAAAQHCRDAKGKFVKCGTAGAKPAAPATKH